MKVQVRVPSRPHRSTQFSETSGTTHLYFNQEIRDIGVYNSSFNVNVDSLGRVISAGGGGFVTSMLDLFAS